MSRYSDIEHSVWEDLKDKSKNATILYLYSFSNPHCRESGLYLIALSTILENTKLREKEFDAAMEELKNSPQLAYDKEKKIMFVGGKFKRRLAGFRDNKNLIKAVEHDLAVFGGSFVTALFIKKYEGALRGNVRDSLLLPLPLLSIKEGGVGETEQPGAEPARENTGRPPEASPQKDKFMEFVFLSQEEFKKLVDRYGKGPTNALIELLNNGIGAKGYKYKSHYHAILNWAKRDGIMPLPKEEKTDQVKRFAAGPPKEFREMVKKIAGDKDAKGKKA